VIVQKNFGSAESISDFLAWYSFFVSVSYCFLYLHWVLLLTGLLRLLGQLLFNTDLTLQRSAEADLSLPGALFFSDVHF
jgi:hypothetical protein